jgi:hypothetical protein
MAQPGESHPYKPSLGYHMYPIVKEEPVLIFGFFSYSHMLFPSTPYVDLNFCCNHETRIIVHVFSPSLEHRLTMHEDPITKSLVQGKGPRSCGWPEVM